MEIAIVSKTDENLIINSKLKIIEALEHLEYERYFIGKEVVQEAIDLLEELCKNILDLDVKRQNETL